ncbi:MAG: hypothetical protein ACI96M_001659 [Candidatus Azotimanducaceae bacterium]
MEVLQSIYETVSDWYLSLSIVGKLVFPILASITKPIRTQTLKSGSKVCTKMRQQRYAVRRNPKRNQSIRHRIRGFRCDLLCFFERARRVFNCTKNSDSYDPIYLLLGNVRCRCSRRGVPHHWPCALSNSCVRRISTVYNKLPYLSIRETVQR